MSDYIEEYYNTAPTPPQKQVSALAPLPGNELKEFIQEELQRRGFRPNGQYQVGSWEREVPSFSGRDRMTQLVRCYGGEYTLLERSTVTLYGESTGWVTGTQVVERVRYQGPLLSHTFLVNLLDVICWKP